MKKQMNFLAIAVAILMMTVLLPITGLTQDDVSSYKVGERVQYKDNSKYDSATRSYPVVWLEGTIIKLYPEYKQVLVRWDKNSNYPSGYEQGYSINDVRHIKAAAAENNSAKDNKETVAGTPVNENNNGGQRQNADAPETSNNDTGRGLMTREEILGYMRAHGYVNGQPKRDVQVCKDLIEQMKRRGVKELFQPGKDDLAPIYENGCATFDTAVEDAALDNQGTPPTLAWLSGTWLLSVIGGTVDTAPGDGYIYRKNESIGKTGFLIISGDGTYVWKVDPSDSSAKYVKGTYRTATAKEMGLYGGVGIVLEKAADGIDWIVFKYQSRVPNKAERIEVEDLVYRGSHRRIGWRK